MLQHDLEWVPRNPDSRSFGEIRIRVNLKKCDRSNEIIRFCKPSEIPLEIPPGIPLELSLEINLEIRFEIPFEPF